MGNRVDLSGGHFDRYVKGIAAGAVAFFSVLILLALIGAGSNVIAIVSILAAISTFFAVYRKNPV